MKKHILEHFKAVDPILHATIIERNITVALPKPLLDPSQYFGKLSQDIIGQQLSGKVADVITNRFLKLFPKREATPTRLMQIPEETLRETGMSWSKARYIRDLAERTAGNTIPYREFPEMGDEAVITELIKVKGIGRWTAEMFLIFTLGRADVFSLGDLGLKNAMKKIYGLKESKTLPKKQQKISRAWSPHRSTASLVLWRSLDA